MTIPFTTPRGTPARQLVAAALLLLAAMAACGDDATTSQQLAILVKGQVQTTAVDTNLCPPDTPIYQKNSKCYESCKKGYTLLYEGVCRPNCKAGYRKITDAKYTNSKTICYKKEDGYRYSKRQTSCPRNTTCDIEINEYKSHRLMCPKKFKVLQLITKDKDGWYKADTDNSFCYSDSYDTAPETKTKGKLVVGDYRIAHKSPRPNCEEQSLATCGGGAFKHCTIRNHNGRDICVWNLPKLGYPTCGINPGNPNEAICTGTE